MRRLLDVRPDEWPLATTLFGAFFLIAALQHLLKPARNAFFLSTAGAANLPWAYIGSAVVSALGNIAYLRFVAPLPRTRQVIGAQLVVAASLLIFWGVQQVPTAWTAGAFYVWMNVFSLLLVSQFFLVINDLFDLRQAKRLLGFIGAGGLVGGTVGAAAAGWLARPLGTAQLLPIGALLAVGSGALLWRAFQVGTLQTTGGTGRDPGDQGRGLSVADALRIVRRARHLRMIALLLFSAILVSTFVDWMFNAAVEATISGQAAQTEYFGRAFAVFNVVALVIQLFATSAALQTLGLAGTLLVLPAAMGLGVAGLLAAPGLLTATLARGADTVFRTSIDQSARELLYLPVPTYLKQRAKPFIDIVVARGADGVAGLLILLGSGVAAFTGRGFTFLTLGLIGLWIAAVVGVRQTYRRALERLLAVRDVDLEEAVETSLDSETMRDLRLQLAPDVEPESVHYALDLLRGVTPASIRPELRRLLEHPDPGVRSRAVFHLGEIAEDADFDRLRTLAEDRDGSVRAEALVHLCRDEPATTLERTGEWLESSDPHELEVTLACLILYGGPEGEARAGEALSRLVRQVGEEGAPVRAASARVLGRLPGPSPLQRHLETLLADGHLAVVLAALRAVTAVPRKDLIPSILPHLERAETRAAAARALAAFGEAGIPWLAAGLRDPELALETRRWLPGVFVLVGTRAAFWALAEGLTTLAMGKHRLYALKALNKMRRRHPGWEVPVELVRDELAAELALAYDVERQRAALARRALTADGARPAAEAYAWALGFQAERSIERAFRLQALLYSPQTIYFAYAGLAAGRSAYGAHAIELLETALARPDAQRLIPLIDPDLTPERRAAIGRQWLPLEERGLAADLEDVLRKGEPWLQAYAAPLAAAVDSAALAPELERLAASGSALVQPVARRALQPSSEEPMPLSSVEKAAALRRAELLHELGADDLLQLAAVAEERAFEAREYLFYEGEDGDYLYVVLDGEIRGERGGQEVFRAGAGEAIGTFSILDQQPRSASAVAALPTRALAIHRADLAQILADNYSLVEGLFKHLTGIIRAMNERVFPTQRPDGGERLDDA